MWEKPVSLICYLLVAACVVFFSIKLSDYVDLLDKKTKVSGAFLGGILLAAVTSLPELFTSITATTLVKQNQYVTGNILGSNLFNMALFFIIFTIFFRKAISAKVSKNHLFSLGFMAVLYAIVAIAAYVFDFNGILWGWFNPMSIAIVAIYTLSIIKTPKEEESENKEINTKLTVKQIISLFVLFSLLLIGASIGITYLTDWVVSSFNIGKTFGGALFLGVATSLPEMTATINLCRKKNFNAAYGNILGSCVFNFIIMSIADILSFGCARTLYKLDQSSFLLLILAIPSMILLFIGLIVQLKGKKSESNAKKFLFIAIGTGVLLVYVAFLILSNINLNIPFAPMEI